MNSFKIFKYDLISFLTYTLLVIFGIVNIYSSTYNESFTTIFDYTTIVGKQLVFLLVCIVAFFLIIFTKKEFFDSITPFLYFISVILLLSLFIFGAERGGAKYW